MKEIKFKLLKDLPLIKAGVISTYNPSTFQYCFLNDTGQEYYLSEEYITKCPDWFEEIKEPKMVWQKSENRETETQWFSSVKQALQFSKHLKASALLRAAIERVNVANGNWKPDWKNGLQIKKCFYYNIKENSIDSFDSASYRIMPDCYYFGEEIGRNTIYAVFNELGKDYIQIIKDFLMID